MNSFARDMTPTVNLTREKGAGAVRHQRPVYVELLPPCNSACPAGENIQAWLSLAQAGKHRAAWETLVRDNPFYIPAEKFVGMKPEDRERDLREVFRGVEFDLAKLFTVLAGYGQL